MYAIIETGGKQYKVTEGDTLFIEKLEAEANAKITFDKVLAVLNGDSATFGAPVVADLLALAVLHQRGRHRGEERQGQEDPHLQVHPQKGLP